MPSCTALARANQTKGIQGQVDNHSTSGSNVAEVEQEERRIEEEKGMLLNLVEVNIETPLSEQRMEPSHRTRRLKNSL